MSILKRFSALCLAIGLLFSAPAMASIFSYITESTGTPSNATYTYVIQRWDPETSGTLNPCYGWSTCYVTINHKHDLDGSGGSAKQLITRIEKLRTLAEVREEVLRNISFPLEGKTNHVGPALNSNQECVGLFYQPNSSGISPSGRLLPGSLCGIAPPPVGACKITEGAVNLNYGDIDEYSLEGAQRYQNINVTCNLAMKVMVIASGSDNGRVLLRSDNSLYADLFLDDYPGETGSIINVPAGGSVPVKVSSTLHTNGRVAPGYFSGSGSIILTMP
ncbi:MULTISPECIES: adhesin [Proteus]|uniref:Adhesin n=1 Tax=Proteus columbae TaxID=1987580 RepID=A0A6I7D1I0_9GAMM|nr:MULTISPECIES: adhesin [Proteus]MBG3018304.1 adhesin [Proteus mirabilis]MBG3150965.1 adhesin [Proteus mirabilis]QHN09716.1 adhesin [Proteus columbae]